jgi:hypothetical protein
MWPERVSVLFISEKSPLDREMTRDKDGGVPLTREALGSLMVDLSSVAL